MSLIAGGNNSGKSTILHGLAIWEFCRTVIEAEKGLAAFLPDSRAQGLGLGDDEFSPINVPSLRHLWTNLAPQKGPADEDGYTLRIKAEWKSDAHKELEFGLALANDRLFVKNTHSNLDAQDKIPRIAYLPPFAGITDREARVPGAIRRRRIGEGLAGAILRNLLLDLSSANASERQELREGRSKISDKDLRRLRETDPWERLQQVLRTKFGAELAISPFSDEYHSYIKVEIVKGTVNGYRLRRHSKFRNRDLMVEGSGFLQWLSVFVLAVTPGIDSLLLDEPDAHLHCSLQQEMVGALEELAAGSGQQILLASHSTEILRYSKPEAILELSSNRKPRFLTQDSQKVGLLAGLGAQYSPRIDRIKVTNRLLLIEGEFDYRVLRCLASNIGLAISDDWVQWKSVAGHKERKQLFLALREEINGLVAVSLRDRDDDPLGTVGDQLEDKSHSGMKNFFPVKWRRRHIESYLIWPPAIAEVASLDLEEVEQRLRDGFGIAIGESYPKSNAPDALLDIRGKDVLRSFGVEPEKVAKKMPAEKTPQDIRELIVKLDGLAAAPSEAS